MPTLLPGSEQSDLVQQNFCLLCVLIFVLSKTVRHTVADHGGAFDENQISPAFSPASRGNLCLFSWQVSPHI